MSMALGTRASRFIDSSAEVQIAWLELDNPVDNDFAKSQIVRQSNGIWLDGSPIREWNVRPAPIREGFNVIQPPRCLPSSLSLRATPRVLNYCASIRS